MQVLSVQLWLLSGLVISSAHHGQQNVEGTVKAKGTTDAHGSPGVVPAVHSDVHPVKAVSNLKDQSKPDSKWPLPQSAVEFSSYLNQTAINSNKPTGGSQLLVPFPPANDPQVMQAPFAYKPERPSLIQHLLGNVPGSNNSSSSFFVTPSSTTTEASSNTNASALSDPLPNPLPGIINASQATVSNTSNAVQEITSLWGTNVQNGFFGQQGNRPSNDEGTASGSTGGSSNPIQSIIDNSQASLNNATGVAQGLVGQFGTNVQNGLTNVLGININRPSNDPPAAPSTEANLAAPTTGSNNVAEVGQSLVGQFGTNVQNGLSSILGLNLNRPSNDEQTSEAATTTQAETSSTEAASTTTTESATVTKTTTASGAFLPLVSFVNNTQALVNSSTLAQAVTSTLTANLQQGFAPFFFPRPSSKDSAENVPERAKYDDKAVASNTKSVAPPEPPSCPSCSSMCYYRPFQGQRIVGGTDVASSATYPWIAFLTYLDSPAGQGSLINDRTIVTTASIIEAMPITMHIRALLGRYNLADPTETINSLEIDTTYVHPGFSTTNPFVDNIGLLILSSPLGSFQPICLPAPTSRNPPVSKATIIGWGAEVANGPLASVLQEAEIQLYTSLVCRRSDLRFTPKNLCGGTTQFTSRVGATCTGDGGDPLVTMNATTWELIGVALDIPQLQCGVARTPAIFTSIIPYLDWITTYGAGCECFVG